MTKSVDFIGAEVVRTTLISTEYTLLSLNNYQNYTKIFGKSFCQLPSPVTDETRTSYEVACDFVP